MAGNPFSGSFSNAKDQGKEMTVAVIGCGSSAKDWFKTQCDYSIGVNDVEKFGHKVNELVVINHPSKFRREPDRMNTIIQSKPDKFICHSTAWKQWFPKAELRSLTDFYNRVSKRLVYCSKTSPFVACSLAYNMGATELVLWGVDMINHKVYSPGNSYYDVEVRNYLRFFELIKGQTKTFVGSEGSVFSKYLPLWKNSVA